MSKTHGSTAFKALKQLIMTHRLGQDSLPALVLKHRKKANMLVS